MATGYLYLRIGYARRSDGTVFLSLNMCVGDEHKGPRVSFLHKLLVYFI